MSPPLPPLFQRWQATIERRVSALERRILARVDAGGPTGYFLRFDQIDEDVVTTYSRVHDVDVGWTFTESTIVLGTAGTSGTTVMLVRNGADIPTSAVTIAAGLTEFTGSFPGVAYARGDNIQVKVSAAGAGAKKISVQVR